jgi:hypothetical protein
VAGQRKKNTRRQLFISNQPFQGKVGKKSGKAVLAGANPTIVNYNASAVKIWKAASSLALLEYNYFFFYVLKKTA